MNVGTKSVLFGAHQFAIHPWFVMAAWWKLYGFPWDARLWIAFFVHDFGYFGKPNMDGPEGETHVEFGAHLMAALFGEEWGNFCRYHSRFYAKRDGVNVSRLCIADKLAICMTPAWMYLPMAKATGEIYEYQKLGKDESAANKYATMNVYNDDLRKWYINVQTYLRRWVDEHKDGRADTWTPSLGKKQ